MIQSVKASQSRLLYTKLHKIHNIQYVKHDTNFKKTGDPQHKSHLLLGILGLGAGNTNDIWMTISKKLQDRVGRLVGEAGDLLDSLR